MIDDRHAVAEPLGLFHVVRCQEHRASGREVRLDDLPQLDPRLRIEARRRLVEKQEIGFADERARDREPLFLSARQFSDASVSLLAKRDLLDRRVDVVAAVIETAKQPDGLFYGELLGELRLLQLDAEPLP